MTNYWLEYFLVKKSGMFDPAYYLIKYPDIRMGDIDPLRHFLNFGWKEHRNPSDMFDIAYYLERYPDVKNMGINPLVHFIRYGRKEGRSPKVNSSEQNCGEQKNAQMFSASQSITSKQPRNQMRLFKIKIYEGIKRKISRLAPSGSKLRSLLKLLEPRINYSDIVRTDGEIKFLIAEGLKVSIIVPNYNHERYLRARLDSIYGQSYKNIEVILLDDASVDNSTKILKEYLGNYPDITKLIINANNSSNVFSQWAKGISLAQGDLVWIAESDDFCETNFLEKIVPFFSDKAIMLAYSHSVFVDENNRKTSFTFESYLSEISLSKWNESYISSAHNEVQSALSIKNTIPNVSSAVFRRPNQRFSLLSDKNWLNMKICGDWIFYLSMIQGGKIAYCRETSNYFRIHPASSSKMTHTQDVYFKEHEQVACFLAGHYDLSEEILQRNREIIYSFYKRNLPGKSENDFDNLYNMEKVKEYSFIRYPNILMGLFAFSTGGGEVVPITLANVFRQKGLSVTILNGNYAPEIFDMREMLDPQIPIIEYSNGIDLKEVVQGYGIEIIHTHHASMENLIAHSGVKAVKNLVHVATTHGMYDMMENNEIPFRDNVKSVDHWFYVAEKNLIPFKSRGYFVDDKFTKINNGIILPEIHPIDRKSLDIPEHAKILCLVSRAMPEKGWFEAIEAIKAARTRSGNDIHLLLIGDGPVYEDLKRGKLPEYIHLLGFKKNVIDFFSLADIGILPSYFKGESVPLTVIECLLSGKPVIATDIGEIGNMLRDDDGELAGILVPLVNNKPCKKTIVDAVEKLTSDLGFYEQCKYVVDRIKSRFLIDPVSKKYLDTYIRVLNKSLQLENRLS